MRLSQLSILLFLLVTLSLQAQQKSAIIQIAYTSDVHYGIYRHAFEGADSVPSFKVNRVMLKKINALPHQTLPNDEGVAANQQVGYLDLLAITGDIANRQEVPLQSASVSWAQFRHDYIEGLKTKNSQGGKTILLLTPGNHDASNSIGYNKPMYPATDPGSMVNIYNLMMHPAKPLTTKDFNYQNDKTNYSRNLSGIHLIFIQLWPDSVNRTWMENDLAQIGPSTPVIIFTHVPPMGDPSHFTDPAAPHRINARYQNLMPEYLQDTTLYEGRLDDKAEQRGWVAFLKRHPNIKAYFHGHENFTEFYTYRGPDNDIALPTFRVDSPMKGKLSASDETKAAFELISIDPQSKRMTVRECLWNTTASKTSPLVWGQSKTIQL